MIDVPCAQPSAEIPIAACFKPAIPGSDYAWAQPGAAVPDVPFAQPPAWIPA